MYAGEGETFHSELWKSDFCVELILGWVSERVSKWVGGWVGGCLGAQTPSSEWVPSYKYIFFFVQHTDEIPIDFCFTFCHCYYASDSRASGIFWQGFWGRWHCRWVSLIVCIKNGMLLNRQNNHCAMKLYRRRNSLADISGDKRAHWSAYDWRTTRMDSSVYNNEKRNAFFNK